MKILHLYSDWRWTGPAEPALQACLSLQQRGHEVLIACRRQPAGSKVNESVEQKIQPHGLAYTTRFGLDRYWGIRDSVRDLVALPRFMRREGFDVVHTHLSHDHALASACVRLLGRTRPLLVRSLYKRTVLPHTRPNRILLKHMSDGLLVFTESYRQAYIDQFGIPAPRVRVAPMVIDTARFHPDRDAGGVREDLGIPASAPVIGLVTRYQRYRRMDVFLQAAAKVVAAEPAARFVLLGASGQMQETVIKPRDELGIRENVITGGYRIDDYVQTLASFDVFSLLMPGFDGTARAVREAMAMGKPCVVTDFGMLPDIVANGRTGLVVPFDADSLANAWLALIRSPARRAAMGRAGREKAEQDFPIERLGVSLEQTYRAWRRSRRGLRSRGG